MNQRTFEFDANITARHFAEPAGYKGLYAFHKYWGKKPPETVIFLLEKLSERGELVFDPFVGSGATAREAFLRQRRFLGCDINPTAIALATLFVDLPPYAEAHNALTRIEAEVRSEIDQSYLRNDDSYATHYLWKNEKLQQVWKSGGRGRLRVECPPGDYDLEVFQRFASYAPVNMRSLKIHKNGRINSTSDMQWGDLFTGRALRNIELLRNSILRIPNLSTRRALLLTLTAASGQMSKMVFAIEKRGKATGTMSSTRVEVGSWVIGFWRPELHFEVNVWNCFENKARAFLRGLRSADPKGMSAKISRNPMELVHGIADISLTTADALEVMENLPKGAVNAIITDPPHNDRIPYLELSEFWNAILDGSPDFDREIVVSDAPLRGKNTTVYAEQMQRFFALAKRTLTVEGRLAIMFNSRRRTEWENLLSSALAAELCFVGCFPMEYSAASVVQDNRKGALLQDFVLLFSASSASDRVMSLRSLFAMLPNWSGTIPKFGED